MSSAFEHEEQDNPFDASYEEYTRTFRVEEGDPFASKAASDSQAETVDDPEVTQASTGNVSDFAARAAGDDDDASWSNRVAYGPNDPFDTPQGWSVPTSPGDSDQD